MPSHRPCSSPRRPFRRRPRRLSSAPTVEVTAPTVPVTAPTVEVTAPTVPVAAPTVPATAPTVPVTAPTVPVTVPMTPVTPCTTWPTVASVVLTTGVAVWLTWATGPLVPTATDTIVGVVAGEQDAGLCPETSLGPKVIGRVGVVESAMGYAPAPSLPGPCSWLPVEPCPRTPPQGPMDGRPGQDRLLIWPVPRLACTRLDVRWRTDSEQVRRYHPEHDCRHERDEGDGGRDNRARHSETRRVQPRGGHQRPRRPRHPAERDRTDPMILCMLEDCADMLVKLSFY